MNHVGLLFAIVTAAAGGGAHATQALSIEVEAPHATHGNKPIDDAIVRLTLPESASAVGPWRLMALAKPGPAREVAVQLDGRDVVFVVAGRLEAGSPRRYRLEPRKPAAFPPVQVHDEDGQALLVTAAGRPVLRYHVAKVQPPKPFDPIYARSAFIHPIWTPKGRIVSNQFPVHHHLHQNGLWFAWHLSTFEGRNVSFWDPLQHSGAIEHDRTAALVSGPVFGGFVVAHRWTDISAPGGTKVAAHETWEVKVYGARGSDAHPFVFDLSSTVTCPGAPLVNRKHIYGGLAFRAAGEWEGSGGLAFLTSEGKTRKDGNETRARWCAIKGVLCGEDTGIAFLGHPENFRAPEPLRLHGEMPYFSFAAPQLGEFSLASRTPFVSRYRIVVHDGLLEAEDLDRRWAAYATPPIARWVNE